MVGILNSSWISERPPALYHIIITRTLGICQAREIRSHIFSQMDIWGKVFHDGLVVDAEAKGGAR